MAGHDDAAPSGVTPQIQEGHRTLFLDTETTGIEVSEGHRVIEVGAVEMVGRRLTGRHFHAWLCPDRDIDAEAEAVHGLSAAFLADKPRFPEIAPELTAFLRGAEIIIHNAPFDTGFLNRELELAGLPPLTDYCVKITDSLKLARELHPGQRNSLDALCKRYGIDNSSRTLHGALLDAELLADAWLAMTRGQESLLTDADRPAGPEPGAQAAASLPDLLILRAGEDELMLHAGQIEAIDAASKGKCLWKLLGTVDGQ